MQTLMRVLAGESLDPPPVWLMRQAGRYLPEYREVRARAGSFLDLCYNPELACEVTLQPIRRFGLDAAILFSDILVVPHALGRPLTFVENEGPKLEPLAGRGDLAAMRPDAIHARLEPVYEAVARIRAALPPEIPLIGFAGAPWTLACYLVDGQGSKDYMATRLLAAREPETFAQLLAILETAIVDYLARQIEAGADVVKLFDSWAGVLPADGFERWCRAPVARIVEALKARHPKVPVLAFPRGAGVQYARYAETVGADAIALDTTVPTSWAAANMPAAVATQGNLDPALLVAGGGALDAAVDRIRADFWGRPHVFNLGHGIVPQTEPAHVTQMLARLREPRR